MLTLSIVLLCFSFFYRLRILRNARTSPLVIHSVCAALWVLHVAFGVSFLFRDSLMTQRHSEVLFYLLHSFDFDELLSFAGAPMREVSRNASLAGKNSSYFIQ